MALQQWKNILHFMIVICLIRTMVSQEQTYGAGANSGKLKVISWFLSGQNQKWVWPFSSWDPKICCTWTKVWNMFKVNNKDTKTTPKGKFMNWAKLNPILLQLYLLDHWQWLEVFYTIGSVDPYICLSVCPGVFLELNQLFLLYWHGARNTWNCAWQSLIFWENVCPQIWKNQPKILI